MGNTLSSYTETEHQLDVGPLGVITGRQSDSKSRRYLSIPYALPPIGDHRWRKPRPLPKDYTYGSREQPYDATNFGPICPQSSSYTKAVKHLPTTNVYDEDCLRLNIWTPVPSPNEPTRKWPVMLWLHGGWFQMGDPSHEEGMDPTELISTGKLNAIVVVIGYRLNLFGFLAGDALKEEGGGACGNYGLWDQRLAIEWVQGHISAFGGDPENVMLAGRSAGACSVQAQALYELQSGRDEKVAPFRRLSMISNAIPAQPKTVDECQEQFDELRQFFDIETTLSGLEKLRRLRGIDAKSLVKSIMKLKRHTFRPVTNSDFIQPGIIEYIRNGEFAKEFKKRGLKLLIGEVLNEETFRVLGHYDLPQSTEKADWATLYGNIIADGQVRAPSRFLASSLTEHDVSLNDIWRYRISYRLSFITEKIAPLSFGVSHAMDRPIWNFSIMHRPTEDERVLMQDWIDDFAVFVKGDEKHTYGTKAIDEFKVMTSEGTIEIQKDERWGELLRLAEVFSG